MCLLSPKATYSIPVYLCSWRACFRCPWCVRTRQLALHTIHIKLPATTVMLFSRSSLRHMQVLPEVTRYCIAVLWNVVH